MKRTFNKWSLLLTFKKIKSCMQSWVVGFGAVWSNSACFLNVTLIVFKCSIHNISEDYQFKSTTTIMSAMEIDARFLWGFFLSFLKTSLYWGSYWIQQCSVHPSLVWVCTQCIQLLFLFFLATCTCNAQYTSVYSIHLMKKWFVQHLSIKNDDKYKWWWQ